MSNENMGSGSRRGKWLCHMLTWPNDRVKITTAGPQSQVYEGTLYTADPVLNIVAINTRNPPTDAPNQSGDYHVIPVSRIQAVQILSLSETGNGCLEGAQPAIGPVDIKQLRQREDLRIRKLKEDEQNRGVGVSAEGQAIFDSLRRM